MHNNTYKYLLSDLKNLKGVGLTTSNLLKRINRDVSLNLLPFTSSMNTNINRITEKPKLKIDLNLKSKVGRNDPCPCGSGKKYKKCYGSSDCDL